MVDSGTAVTGDGLVGVRLLVEPQEGCGYPAVLRCASAARDLGFEGVFCSDHFVRTGPGGPGAGPLDAWVLLASLAVQVPDIRLGSLVSPVTFRNPVMLAVAAAQVDQISEGRVELGVGAGWHETEHRALGVELPAAADRIERLDEALTLIRALWETPQDATEFSFAGRWFQTDGQPGGPVPVQKPRPPLIVGGTGRRRVPEIAARHADEYNVPFLPAQDVETAYERLRKACEAAGRRDPIRQSAAVAIYTGTSETEAQERARAAGEDPQELFQYGGCGTVPRMAEILDGYWAAGAERIYLQITDPTDLDHLALLADVARAAPGPQRQYWAGTRGGDSAGL